VVAGWPQGRLQLAQLGKLLGGMDYAAVCQALGHFGKRLRKDAEIRSLVDQAPKQLSHGEMTPWFVGLSQTRLSVSSIPRFPR